MKTMENEKRKNISFFANQSQSLSKVRSKTLYNIQDYLPDKEPIQSMISFKEKAQNNVNFASLQSSIFKTKTQAQQNAQFEGKHLQVKINELKAQIQKLKQQKQEFKKKTLSQFEEKVKRLEQMGFKKDKQIQELQDIVKQNKRVHHQLIQELEEVRKSEKSQREEIEKRQRELKLKDERKRNNLQFYLHKYQVCLQPKIKQTYTIQVQTQQQQYKKLNSEQLLTFQQNKPSSNWSNRKTSQPTKTNFYQMYQQKNEVSNFDHQITSRSNQKGSANKPQRPRFVSHGEVNNDKENDKKRLNERIQGRRDYKHRIRQEEIEIYPIQQDKLGTIIDGILRWT